ncbi:hypothetical protein [Natronoflexus pectinivorans]|uniref:Uncharacterized protein n=1 Tax=Natronoflexus pectinivorans TaxID=682526 RepID=A0A4R2GH60_9BACT|nr:hypothetical protein [Natronoflexus pectinivorans]TCO07719.1 hypothetical protein EV194_107103 [Natronoflexus pectinivorans]
MKKFFLFIVFISLSISMVSQRISRDSKSIQFVNYPSLLMPGVETYSTSIDLSAIEGLLEEGSMYVWTYKTLNSILGPQGYTHKENESDIEITLVAKNYLVFPSVTDASPDYESAYYLPTYTIPLDWEIVIEGAVSQRILLSEYKDSLQIVVPLRDVGGRLHKISDAEKVKEIMEGESEQILKSAERQFLSEIMLFTSEVVNRSLSYDVEVLEVPLFSLRSNRQVDVTDWEDPHKNAEKLFEELRNGVSPNELYNKYTDVFDFYALKIEEFRGDVRKNRNLLEAASTNLINMLMIVKPDAITVDHIDVFVETNNESGSREEKRNKLMSRISHALAVYESRNACERDYADLFNMPPLSNNEYAVTYTMSSGETKQGVVTYSTFYGLRPSDACVGFSLYDIDVFNSSDGKVSSRQALDVRDIDSYEIFGDKYVKVRFSDPTVVSLRGEESFMWELMDGDVSIYWLTDSGRSGAVIRKGNRGQLVFNYARLAEMLDDKPAIAEKIRNGHYGNPEIRERSSRLGNMMQQGVVNDICPRILLNIVADYNELN